MEHHRASDQTCAKVEHGKSLGMLHGEDDDGPFVVEGCWYCGRCHHFIDVNGFCSPKTAKGGAE